MYSETSWLLNINIGLLNQWTEIQLADIKSDLQWQGCPLIIFCSIKEYLFKHIHVCKDSFVIVVFHDFQWNFCTIVWLQIIIVWKNSNAQTSASITEARWECNQWMISWGIEDLWAFTFLINEIKKVLESVGFFFSYQDPWMNILNMCLRGQESYSFENKMPLGCN